MKRNIHIIIGMLALTILMSSCKKEFVIPKVGNTSTGNPVSENNFIEFKIDGVPYSINAVQSPTLYSIGEVSKYDTSSIMTGVHYTGIEFMNLLGPNNLTNCLVYFLTPNTLSTGTYQYTTSQYSTGGSSMQFMMSDNNFYVNDDSTSVTLTVTTLQPYKGGKLQGTFTATNMRYSNANANTISKGHQLTDGRFSVTFN